MRNRLQELYGWNRPVSDLFNEMERWMNVNDSLFAGAPRAENFGFRPNVDVQERDAGFLLSFDLPGLKSEEIKIEVEGDRLTVSGERRQEERKDIQGTHYVERRFGQFSRSFSLPKAVDSDAIEANYADGVLQLLIPKREVSKAKTISVKKEKASLFDRLLGREEGDDTH